MRVLIDLQAFQHRLRPADSLSTAARYVLRLVEERRDLDIEPLLAYDPRFQIDENQLFRQLARHCSPSSFIPYPFPPHLSSDLGSINASTLLVEQTWLRACPDAVLVVDGKHGALPDQILPEDFPLASACWGALLVEHTAGEIDGLIGQIREDARILRYHTLIDAAAKVANGYTTSGPRHEKLSGALAPGNEPVMDWPQRIVSALNTAQRQSNTPPPTRRPRMALFAPVTNDHCHASAYYRAVLPYLALNFTLDVWNAAGTGIAISHQSPLAARPGERFEGLADSYDLIGYALDNTRETAKIIEYLQAYPGVAILHDRSFNRVFAALEETSGAKDIGLVEALFTHGTRARRFLSSCDAAATPSFADLPLGRTLFELATGVVVFSPGQLADLESQFGRRWPIPSSTARLIVHSTTEAPAQRAMLRRNLGFAESDRVVLIPTGLFSPVALDAFAAQLDELASPEVKAIALDAVCPPNCDQRTRHRIRFTGPLSDDQRASYLTCADLAIHNCSASPGWAEMCLGSGIRLLFSDRRSAEYYGHTLSATVEGDLGPLGIARFLGDWARHGNDACKSEAAPVEDFVKDHHSARSAGFTLCKALAQLAQVTRDASPMTLGDRLAQIGRQTDIPERELAGVASALFRAPMTPRLTPQRMLVDVTNTADREFVTGIERVVTEITTRMCRLDRPGICVEPITMRGNQLFEPTPWLFRHGLLRPEELPSRTGGRLVTPEAQDIMLMIDSSWDRIGDFAPHYRRVQEGAGAVYTVVYDLLPVQLPHCFESGAKAWFSRWIERAVALSDGLICISKSVADDLISHIQTMNLEHKPSLRIGYWHLGSKFVARDVTTAPSDRVRSAGQAKPFLMVGTIEPRKRHTLVLEAFEALWKQDEDVTLAITGREGWMVESLMARLRIHPELNKRLHLIEEATDDELAFLYGSCHSLIQASDNEGFGLPIIEATQYGKPVILSDIPVFREIAGENASYFKPGDMQDLTRIVRDSRHGKVSGESRKIPWKTWDQSVEQLADVIFEQRWYRIID